MIPPRKRILVIDDSPASLVWQLVMLQEEQRYDTITATTPAQGLRIALCERPDLIVLDVSTRNAEALAAVQQLRVDPSTRDIPLLMLATDRAFASTTEELGALSNGVITKPIDGVEYLRKVSDLLS